MDSHESKDLHRDVNSTKKETISVLDILIGKKGLYLKVR